MYLYLGMQKFEHNQRTKAHCNEKYSCFLFWSMIAVVCATGTNSNSEHISIVVEVYHGILTIVSSLAYNSIDNLLITIIVIISDINIVVVINVVVVIIVVVVAVLDLIFISTLSFHNMLSINGFDLEAELIFLTSILTSSNLSHVSWSITCISVSISTVITRKCLNLRVSFKCVT